MKAVETRQVNLYGLPIPVHHEKDSGQYITVGVVVAKDPVTGQRNVSIHRLQVTDKKTIWGFSCCRGISWLYREWLKNQEIHSEAPSVLGWILALLSSQAIAALGFDEFGIAGKQYGEPMKLVRRDSERRIRKSGIKFIRNCARRAHLCPKYVSQKEVYTY